MADQKITQLNAATTLTTDDLLVMVDDPLGSPETKKITYANVLSALGGNLLGGGTLLAFVSYDPNPLRDITTTASTGADVDATNLAITFTVPASGQVVVCLSAVGYQSTSNYHWWNLRTTAGSNVSGTLQLMDGNTSAQTRRHARFFITGLTPGTVQTYRWGFGVNTGTVHFNVGNAGGTTTPTAGAAIMEVYDAGIGGIRGSVGQIVQQVYTETGAVATGTTLIPDDDTIPQNTEGDQYMSLAITPTSATNILKIDVVGFFSSASASRWATCALFQDSTANALAAGREYNSVGTAFAPCSFTHYMTAGTISPTTFKVRAGSDLATTMTFNGQGGGRKMGGVLASSITITEINPNGTTATVDPATFHARLTTETGVAVSTSDRASQSTLYLTPYQGNKIALYNGSGWREYFLTADLSLVLSGLTSGKPYDVFLNYNSGVPVLELVVWTNDTTRATALVTQDGVLVQNAAATKRYVGTIYTTSTTATEDIMAKRFVFNYYNRVWRKMKNAIETTDTWNYTTATTRQANANPANQLDYVTGDVATMIDVTVQAMCFNASGGFAIMAGIGIDSTTTNSADYFGSNPPSRAETIQALYKGTPGVGRHFIAWLENGGGTGTTTWYGDAASPTFYQSGISGALFN